MRLEAPRKKKEETQDAGPGSFLQGLREGRGLSQRALAEKSGISRTRLRRLEGPEFHLATYGELLGLSEALGVGISELFQRESASPSTRVHFGKAGEQAFQLNTLRQGCRILSLHPPRPELFTGKLFVLPKRYLPPAILPRVRTVFIQMLLGALKVEVAGEAYSLEPGDHLIFPGLAPYTLENPYLREAVAFLVTTPGFERQEALL